MPQKGQIHSNNSSAATDQLFECVWPIVGFALKGLTHLFQIPVSCFLSHWGPSMSWRIVKRYGKNVEVKLFHRITTGSKSCVKSYNQDLTCLVSQIPTRVRSCKLENCSWKISTKFEKIFSSTVKNFWFSIKTKLRHHCPNQKQLTGISMYNSSCKACNAFYYPTYLLK